MKNPFNRESQPYELIGSDYYLFPKKAKKKYWLNILLFVVTFVTCMVAGTQWQMKDHTEIANWHYGLNYAILILTFLSAHEFGHYFASKIHKVESTLPYYIPAILPDMFFGTFGAVIKTKTAMKSKKALFDIGIAGPISGFIVAIAFIIIGYSTLPPKDFIYTMHPAYLKNGGHILETGLYFGDNLIFLLFNQLFGKSGNWLPPMNEIYHYPFLCVGWFGLFVTSLNMLPIGQLDGGHIIYSMFGEKQKKIARITWWILIFLGSGALLNIILDVLSHYDMPNSFYINIQDNLIPALNWLKMKIPWYFSCWGGWIFWGLMVRFVIKIDHPDIVDLNEELSPKRKLLGWISIIILILTFSFNGLYVL